VWVLGTLAKRWTALAARGVRFPCPPHDRPTKMGSSRRVISRRVLTGINARHSLKVLGKRA